MPRSSLRERTTARIGLNVRPSFRKRIDDYSVARDVDITQIMTEGADIYMAGYVPVIGSIPCGPLAEALAETPYFDVAPPTLRPASSDFYLEATGDSMEPEIRANDLVLLRPDIEFANGDICAIQAYENDQMEGPCTATLKQVYRTGDPKKLELRAHNPAYKPMTVPASRVRIVGVMRGLVRSTI